MRSLSWYLVGGIADAATKYAQERDAELRRQTARHVAFLAHELRNPLSSMKLAFAKVERDGLIPGGHRSATILRGGLMRLTELVDQALIEVRLAAGGDLNLEELDLNAFVQTLEAEIAEDAEEKQITIERDLQAARLRADRRYLHSALSNLLRNAVKFTQVGGTIQMRAKETGDRVIFEIEDQCGGLPEGNVQKLFDPFVQLGQDRSGFGLGLAIAKRAVDAHEGALRVHDLPGRGCVFVLELPTAGPSETRRHRERAGGPDGCRRAVLMDLEPSAPKDLYERGSRVAGQGPDVRARCARCAQSSGCSVSHWRRALSPRWVPVASRMRRPSV